MMKQQSTLDLSALDINSNIAAKNYWRNRLSDFQFVNYFKRRELPVAALTAGMDSCAITADQAVKQAFNELAGSAAAKHIVLMAAIGALMSKYTSSADIMVFTPTYKNEDNRVGGDDIIPFRMHAAETLTFAELVAAVKDNLVRDLGYSNYPVERILGKAKTALPWSSCIGMMVDEIQSDAAFGELPVGLLFRFDTSEGGLSLNISYNGTLYLPAFVNTIASRFFNLLGKLLANRRVPLKSVALLTPDEKEKLFGEIVHCAQHSPLAASYHQERMWFIDYFEAGDLYEGGPVYHNIPLILDLEGTPDVPLLAQSVQTLLDRYAILRTVIENADDRITQREITVSGFQFRYAAIDSDQDVEAVTSEEINTPMKLDSLLVRGLLINKGEKRFRMVLVFHHAIADRYSVKLLARQLLDNYYAGGNAVPAVPVVPYHHFSTWQRERFEDLEFHLFPFWDQLLSGGRLKALELPTDRPRAKIHIYKAAVADIAWPQRITEKLLEYQAATGQNVGLILMAAFKVLLYRYARHEEIVIGASADNRNVETLKGMIGPVANLVVIRSFVREDQSFKNYLDTLSAIYDSCMAHSEMPFDKLVADLAPEKDMARTALFDVLFQYEETTNDLPSTAALLVTEQETNLGYGKYDLNLLLQLRDNRLAGKLVFNEEYLDSATVADFLHNFYELAYNLISSPDERLSSIPLLSAEAASSLLLSLDHSQVGYPSEATVHRLFERQAALHPGRTALAFNGDTMSYAALHAASDRVAAYLRNEGVKPGVIVGLLLERGMEVVVGMLGILKAGGAYLPLDVEYPASRKSYMISDSGMPFLLTARNVTDAGDYGVPVHYMEDGLSFSGALDNTVSAGPSDLCYVIYTSGTTGNPKGVMVGHSQVVRLFFNDAPLFDFNEADVWTMFHSPCFDFSVWEMYGALLHGGRLVIIPRMTARDPQAYLSVLAGEGVTVLNQTPGSFYQLSGLALASGNKDLRLRYVIFGGEALVPPMLRNFHRVYPEVKLINMFGITETTVHVTYKELSASDLEQDVSNIGRPIPTLSVYILDEQLRPVPRGVVGELYVGGAGVAQGYLGKAELTAQRFVAHPFGEGRLYRSGDQGRQLAGGDIEYLGRIDSQVKVRGFRIELGEIESHLSGYEGIQSCVVHTYEADGEKSLAAYYVSADEIDHSGLRQYLSVRLPDYQVPSYYMRLSSLPLTGNGKIDRKALPAPVVDETATFVAAADELESSLVDIWSEVLKTERERISVTRSFFELGGHSLKVTLLANKIQQFFSVTVAVKDIFTHQDIRSLAGHIRTCLRGSYTPIPAASPSPFYPLSSVQRRLHFLYELDRDSLAYNMLQVVRLEGAVELSYLTACFHQLIRRHESLRTAIVSGMQQVLTEVDFAISVYEGSEAAAPDIIRAFHRPFDLSQAPLLRIGLIKLSAGHHLLLMDMHHIITDGISQFLLIGEFMRIYAGDTLPALRLGYKDYAVWQESASQRAMQEQHRSYWKSVFADGVPLLHLPLDYKRPLIKDDKGGVVRFSLSREEVSALQALASRSQSTLFMVMLSLYNVLLSRVCNQDDIVVGTSVSGRYHADLEPLTGMFVNTLPLRHHPHGDQSFLSFLTTVRDRTLESFEHQSYPLEAMVEDLSPERDTSRSPLFDVMFGYENIDVTTLAIPGLKLEPYLHEEYASKFDLTLTVSERGDDLQLDFEYAASLFNSSTVHRLITYFKNIVRAVIADNEVLLSAIVMLPEAEEHTLLHVFNNTARSYGNTTFPDVFKDQAALYPHHIAATYRGVDTDYRTLHETSNRMAHYLHSIGLPAGAVVPLLLDRGVDLLSWIIGIQKAGGVFIALDTRHPADRIAGILDGCNPALVVTEEKYTGLLKAGCPMVLHETVATTAHDRSVSDWMSRKAADIAYAAYTSGSTGVPKGVLLHHGGMMNHFHGLKELLGLTSDDRFAQTAECSFDVYLVQMLLALTVGGCTHIIDRDVMLDAGLLSAELVAGDITILEVVPSVVRLLVNAAPLPLGKLRWVISTGEALSRELAVAWYRCYPDVRLLNLYGPAETSDDATYYIVPPDLQEQGVGNVPIGQPLPNFHIHVLDAARNLCPVGVSGEICIAGPGVGKGYIADVSLTASKFVPNPFASHDTSDAYAVMYRTGDVGYRDEQGMIYLTGRIDNMIKIRGARIETGDIEALLLQFAGIRDVLVLSRENKEQQYLAAYYIAEGEIDAAVLAAYLTGKLPEYMVPTAYVHLTAFPLTLSGKVNKRELPEPVFGSEAFQAPVTDEEILLAGIWCKILGMARVGTADNFFSLGGDSIKSIQIISRVRAAGYELSMKDIFANQTIAGLARCLKVLRAQPRQDIVKGEAALTPVQRFFFDGPAAGDAHFNQSVMLHFPQGITAGEVQQIFGYLQQHHDALRIVIKETAEGLRLDTKPEQPVSLTVYDAYNEAACTALQGSMDLTAGPLMKLGLFREKDGSHLLIVVHHLVTDGVSWRILLEDMATLYGQLQQKQTLSLPGKTTPFLSWSAHLHHYMESASFRSGRAYWQAQEKRGLQGFIPRDMPEGSNRGEEMRTVRFTLDSMRTHELLRQAPDTFRTSVEEVLLAAFVAAVAQQYGQQQVCVDLEGHGREEILPGVDISRTVGWFTSIYPVMLELKGTTWSDRLRHVKETLRTIPNKGIDYLLCRYYDNSLADAEASRISFNYLGQFDSDTSSDYYRISGLGRGHDTNPRGQREYDWDVTGMITGDALEISIAYSASRYRKETMVALQQHYESCLLSLTSYCLDKAHTALSPSDVTGKGISMETLDALQSQYRIQDVYPLSPMQEGMLFHTLYDNHADHYFEQISYILHGRPDIQAVEQTLNALIARYDILRTVFLYEGYDRALQVVLKERAADFTFLDLQEACAAEGEAVVVARYREEDKQRKFVLDRDTLLRLTVAQVAPERYRFFWSLHHILMDGWCMGLLIHDFNELYEAAAQGRSPQLEAVRPYANYISWLEQRDPAEGLAYWEKYLEGYDRPAGLPQQSSVPEGAAFRPSSRLLELSPQQALLLNAVSVKYGVSVYTVFQCIWGLLLQRYNDCDDVVFGSVVSGRPVEVEGVESMLGLFINTVPVRVRSADNERVGDLLRRIQQELLDSEAYHYNMLPDIQSRSGAGRQLLDHILIYENYPLSDELGGQISDMDVFEQTNYDLSIVIVPGSPFTVRFDYNRERYSDRHISQVMSHLDHLVTVVAGGPDMLVSDVSLLCVDEGYNDTAVPFEEDISIVTLFERQVMRTPDAIALEHEAVELSYAALHRLSTDMAARLSSQGIGAGDFVGVLLDREPGFVYSVLGIMQSGAAYVPVDTIYPAARVSEIFADAGVKAVITRKAYAEHCGDCRVICLEETEQQPAEQQPAVSSLAVSLPGGNQLAYMIYTSGSTGVPKGVMISHRSLVNYIQWASEMYLEEGAAVFSLYTSVSFDLTITSLFTPLVTGGRLLLYSGHDSLLLEQVIKDNRSTVLKMTPSHLKLLLEMEVPVAPVLRTLIVGGEQLESRVAAAVHDLFEGRVSIYNEYGPTEATVGCMYYRYGPSDTPVNVPIGYPAANTHIYLLDRYGRAVPEGAAGELYISGAGLAQGYHGRKALTDEVFVPNPFVPGTLMYRSKDTGIYDAAYGLLFTGRRDSQLKVRGYRIEPGEIVYHVCRQPGVREAAVLQRNGQLVCYYVSDEAQDSAALQGALQQVLPAYMVPVYYLHLHHLPLTGNGKLDESRLPAPEAGVGGYAAPTGDTAIRLAAIWADVLKLDVSDISATASFFAMGGHSLNALVLRNRIYQAFKVQMTLKDLFEHSTLEKAAEYIDNETWLKKDGRQEIATDEEYLFD